ncbi:hypothetical protein PGT21_013586 [Puccinia graminis f. sp. tritici]|uniref:Uncharacterized protein n=1 Tax=Puccinia graminis f. sp. tritici TaxID=56615 RepID=A0A5B0SC42_PUCGR|nr:hypothetical protein PGT21_013586 [Puccinia graminis f. sp. tritici]KAA1134004.1 hypothetical protein PGTUg99_012466 [Puccinia graminis f. sp. tritici]
MKIFLVLVVLLMCASYVSSGRIPNGDIRQLSKSTEPKPGRLAPQDDEDSCSCIIDHERQEQCGDTELCSGGCGKCASHCTCSDGAADSTRSSSDSNNGSSIASNGSSKASNADSDDQEESSLPAESSPPGSLHTSDSE